MNNKLFFLFLGLILLILSLFFYPHKIYAVDLQATVSVGITKVIIQGKAYPNCPVTILKDGSVFAITVADNKGNFKVEKEIDPGTYTFSIWAVDKEGRKSTTFSFTVHIVFNTTTTISGIIIPPTISVDKAKVKQDEVLNIDGYSASQVQVKVYIDSPQIVRQTSSNSAGYWKLLFNVSLLDEGSHNIRARTFVSENESSTYSNLLFVEVERRCQGADFNFDGKVNLFDFSILLYWWNSTSPGNPCADINQDGRVNIIDFSIMLYYWTG